ncbi:MAG: 6-phosphofructokinase, partial [Myxococcota bacterium]
GTGALGDFLAELIKTRLGKKLRVRADTFGYLQRSYPESVSDTDRVEARAVGRFAAELAAGDQHRDGSVAIKRVSQEPYRVRYERIELTAVAAKTRRLPSEYVVDGKNIAESYKAYAGPLVGELPSTEQL